MRLWWSPIWTADLLPNPPQEVSLQGRRFYCTVPFVNLTISLHALITNGLWNYRFRQGTLPSPLRNDHPRHGSTRAEPVSAAAEFKSKEGANRRAIRIDNARRMIRTVLCSAAKQSATVTRRY